MKLKIDFSKLRNAACDMTIKAATKAKAKPRPINEIRQMLKQADLTDAQKLQALDFLQAQIEEMSCSK